MNNDAFLRKGLTPQGGESEKIQTSNWSIQVTVSRFSLTEPKMFYDVYSHSLSLLISHPPDTHTYKL